MSQSIERKSFASEVASVCRGVIARPDDGGICQVELDSGQIVDCLMLLQPGTEQRKLLREGTPVLVWHSPGTTESVILGQIGSHNPMSATASDDELVISARKSLTLKVGDGSITIREDGRILIKGKDLVSHAKRMNRIRGGSVQIN
jgi:hypothetical protein